MLMLMVMVMITVVVVIMVVASVPQALTSPNISTWLCAQLGRKRGRAQHCVVIASIQSSFRLHDP